MFAKGNDAWFKIIGKALLSSHRPLLLTLVDKFRGNSAFGEKEVVVQLGLRDLVSKCGGGMLSWGLGCFGDRELTGWVNCSAIATAVAVTPDSVLSSKPI
jgi:hypothetical protein